MSIDEIVGWIREYLPYASEEECLDAFQAFRNYRDEGQSLEVSKQYAGLI